MIASLKRCWMKLEITITVCFCTAMCVVLSRGKVLRRFVARLKEIRTFLEMKGSEQKLSGSSSFTILWVWLNIWISSSHWTKIWRESHDRKRSWRASTCGQKWKNFNPKTSWLSELGTRLLSHTTHYSVSIAVLTMFGFTYACEQSFSHLKNITTNLRSRLTDESLNACVKLNLTKYQPDYKAISKSMQEPEVALMLSIITILFKIINSEAYFTQI